MLKCCYRRRRTQEQKVFSAGQGILAFIFIKSRASRLRGGWQEPLAQNLRTIIVNILETVNEIKRTLAKAYFLESKKI